MTLHELDHTLATSPIHEGTHTVDDVRVAEAAVEAFKLALRELGEAVPANAYRAVLTSKGLRLEVQAAPGPIVTNYGTPAPVEEIAEFLEEDVDTFLGRDHVALPAAPAALGETVSTVAELDALPVGAVLHDRDNDPWTKTGARKWDSDLTPEDVLHWAPLTVRRLP